MPSLIIALVFACRTTLSAEFLLVHFFIYMDDAAFVVPYNVTMLTVIKCVTSLSDTLGFRVNTWKTEIYKLTRLRREYTGMCSGMASPAQCGPQ